MLIFCSSRKGCESTARHVSRFLKKFSPNIRSDDSEFHDVALAIDALRKCPAGLDPVLEETLPAGVAYHHAGLTVFFCFGLPSSKFLLFFPYNFFCFPFVIYFDG